MPTIAFGSPSVSGLITVADTLATVIGATIKCTGLKQAENTTTNLFTVTAGKKAVVLGWTNIANGAGVGSIYLQINDTSHLLLRWQHAAGSEVNYQQIIPPGSITLQAGDILQVRSDAAGTASNIYVWYAEV